VKSCTVTKIWGTWLIGAAEFVAMAATTRAVVTTDNVRSDRGEAQLIKGELSRRGHPLINQTPRRSSGFDRLCVHDDGAITIPSTVGWSQFT
jgi:hypothetical protein